MMLFAPAEDFEPHFRSSLSSNAETAGGSRREIDQYAVFLSDRGRNAIDDTDDGAAAVREVGHTDDGAKGEAGMGCDQGVLVDLLSARGGLALETRTVVRGEAFMHLEH